MLIREIPFFYETKEYGMWECIREIDKDRFAGNCWERQTLKIDESMRNWDYENDYPGIPYHRNVWVEVHESIYHWFNPNV